MTFAIPSPGGSGTLFVRTDFTNDVAWERLRESVSAPSDPDGFLADLEFVNDPELQDLTPQDLARLVPEPPPYFAFLADAVTLSHPDSPILVVDLDLEPGSSMRAVPHEVWSIENNLSIGNMEFSEFSRAAETAPDRIFRGF